MEQFNVKFSDMNQVNLFVNDAERIKADIDIIYGRCIVDAKSFLGICSLDMSNVLVVKIHSTDNEELENFARMAEKYGV